MSNQERTDQHDPQSVDDPDAHRKTELPYDESMTEGDEANAPDYSEHESGGDEQAGGRQHPTD